MMKISTYFSFLSSPERNVTPQDREQLIDLPIVGLGAS